MTFVTWDRADRLAILVFQMNSARKHASAESAVIVDALVVVVAVAAIATTLAFTSDHVVNPALATLYRTWAIAAPVIVGLLWRYRRPTSRYTGLLFALGGCAALLAWQSAAYSLLFTIGVAAEAATVIVLFALAITYPTGRIDGRAGLILIGVVSAAVVVTFVPWLLSSADLRVDSPLLDCPARCPVNAFAVLALGSDLVSGLLTVGAIVLAIVGAAVVARSGAGLIGNPAQRRNAVSALFASVPAVLLAVLLFVAETHGSIPATGASRAVALALGLLWLAVPLGVMAAQLRSDLYAAGALDRLIRALAANPTRDEWRNSLAEAAGDPRLELTVFESQSAAANGEAVSPRARNGLADDRLWIDVRADGESLAEVAADASIASEPELITAMTVATSVLVTSQRLESERLDLAVRAEEATDYERARMARDMDVGVRQRLSALREFADSALDQTPTDNPDRASIAAIAEGIDLAMVELRETIWRPEPAVVARDGIGTALRAARRGAPITVHIVDRLRRRSAPQVELAVYYACVEALQNTIKHAGPGARATITLDEIDDGIGFAVTDDGAGFDPESAGAGAGLRNIRDRLEAVGGAVAVSSSPGGGTSVVGTVPGTGLSLYVRRAQAPGGQS